MIVMLVLGGLCLALVAAMVLPVPSRRRRSGKASSLHAQVAPASDIDWQRNGGLRVASAPVRFELPTVAPEIPSDQRAVEAAARLVSKMAPPPNPLTASIRRKKAADLREARGFGEASPTEQSYVGSRL